jgi:peptidoglycan/xylan/chitin deacetylase (PgdA/CDA1 family)
MAAGRTFRERNAFEPAACLLFSLATAMIASLKRSSLSLSKHLGFSGLLAHSEWRRRRLLVLCYHGVGLNDEHEWNPRLYVSAAQFERRLSLISRNKCSVLPLEEAIARLYSGDLPDRAVVLTFDDGYFDFLAGAWPILRKYGYPATVYLTTARVYHNFPVVNPFLSYALWKARERVLDGRGINGLDGEYPLATAEHRQRVCRGIAAAMRARPHTGPAKDVIVRTVVDRLGLDYDAFAVRRVLTLMRPDEVERLSGEGADFQLHTEFHRTPEDVELFIKDVLLNRERIERLTGVRPNHFCYPSGVYRLPYLPALRREGVISATTCDPNLAAPTSEPLLLPRFVDSSSISDIEFEGWLTGIASCLPRRTRRAHSAVS